MTELGTYIQVNDKDGDYFRVFPEFEQSIDAYVERYISSGRTYDSIIVLTLLDGTVLKILSSQIASWFISTAESRLKALECEHLYTEEEKANKQALGIWSDE